MLANAEHRLWTSEQFENNFLRSLSAGQREALALIRNNIEGIETDLKYYIDNRFTWAVDGKTKVKECLDALRKQMMDLKALRETRKRPSENNETPRIRKTPAHPHPGASKPPAYIVPTYRLFEVQTETLAKTPLSKTPLSKTTNCFHMTEIALGDALCPDENGYPDPNSVESPRDKIRYLLQERKKFRNAVGRKYAEAVATCLNSDYTLGSGDLKEKDVRDAFYENVVLKLEHCVEELDKI
ncbi:hypothetical protein BDD12DRAFT_883506 [Trichophaea hybrida]|nr:hypothetical protein BDD12DRAFT_883506 [Trichophaea hybrida]